MRSALLLAAVAGAVAAAVACGSGGIEHLSDTSFDDGGVGPDSKLPGGPAGSGLVTGLPCDVQALVENRCLGCHSGEQPGTPKLSEYSDFLAPSKADATKTMAQAAILRMKSTTARMPPAPAEAADADEIAVMEKWVSAGTKRAGACTTTPPPAPGDGGTSGDAGRSGDGGTPTTACLSGVMWTQGNTKSPLMHPGAQCNACHSALGGPNLTIAGTVYKASHDVDDCNGAAPPPTITVTITDKNDDTFTATTNAAGNFFLKKKNGNGNGNAANPVPPFKASLSDGTNTRQMVGTVTSGDCNFCHTAAGANNAPGRILAP